MEREDRSGDEMMADPIEMGLLPRRIRILNDKGDGAWTGVVDAETDEVVPHVMGVTITLIRSKVVIDVAVSVTHDGRNLLHGIYPLKSLECESW